MAGSTVNISFSKELLAEIDETAKQESRTRSELIREAARLYIGRKARWERIFAFGSRQARRLGLRLVPGHGGLPAKGSPRLYRNWWRKDG
jgi:CopG family transcriptional regulator/antitoxin EndoAI